MKLQPDRADGVNFIQARTPGELVINGQSWSESILVPATGPVMAWPPTDTAALLAEHIEMIVAAAPELVILGTGLRLRFASPALLQPLMKRRIGVETMDTAAACRTYNVLVSEGRDVMAALMLAPGA
ncbi:MAG: Mth938-like domain-containing protein [Pseudomonadota bacterium]